MNFQEYLTKRSSYTEAEQKSPPLPFKYSLNLIPFKKFWYEYIVPELSTIKRDVTSDSKKKSVIVFGCSFAEGSRLEYNENFEYQLSKATNRTVYNRGIAGFGLSEAVYLTKLDDFYKGIKIPPAYVFYVYIPDHFRRIYSSKYGLDKNVYLSYKYKDNKLVEDKSFFSWFNRFYIVKAHKRNKINEIVSDGDLRDKNFTAVKMYLKEMKKELEKRYPNFKFIIIKYPQRLGEKESVDMNNSEVYCYYTDRWKELEEEGFIIYDLKDKIKENLDTEEYTVFDGHPNSKAWSVIINKLLKDIPELK